MSAGAKCECRHCGGHIKFEAENFQPGKVIECPHCGQRTALKLPFWQANATRLRIGVYILIFVVAAIAIQSHFNNLSAQMDRTLEAASHGIDVTKGYEDARKKAAEATAELKEWNKNLTNSP